MTKLNHYTYDLTKDGLERAFCAFENDKTISRGEYINDDGKRLGVDISFSEVFDATIKRQDFNEINWLTIQYEYLFISTGFRDRRGSPARIELRLHHFQRYLMTGPNRRRKA